MRKEYDIEKLNPRPNPYAKSLKKQITINLNQEVIDFFKTEADKTGIPYQILINSYLLDCVRENRHLDMKWS